MEPSETHGTDYGKPADPSVASYAEEERALLDAVMGCECRTVQAVANLVAFYHRIGRQELAQAYADRLLGGSEDLNERAGRLFMLGIAMEGVWQFAEAAAYYRQGLMLEPGDPDLWYFLQNNLGYSLNQLGDFQTAEDFCRRAIEVNSARHNAHKNLGVALAGQGQYREAITSLLTAAEACPQDPRALRHIEEILVGQPELLSGEPALGARLDLCRQRVGKPTGQEGRP